MTTRHHGSCLCGAVRFEAPPLWSCQRAASKAPLRFARMRTSSSRAAQIGIASSTAFRGSIAFRRNLVSEPGVTTLDTY
jgi:hypothetical protein